MIYSQCLSGGGLALRCAKRTGCVQLLPMFLWENLLLLDGVALLWDSELSFDKERFEIAILRLYNAIPVDLIANSPVCSRLFSVLWGLPSRLPEGPTSPRI